MTKFILYRQMYQTHLGSLRTQRIDRTQLPSLRFNSADKFSSYQSSAHSDRQPQEFSFFQSAKKSAMYQKKLENCNNYILVQQMPLQYVSLSRRHNNDARLSNREIFKKGQRQTKLESKPRQQRQGRQNKQNDSLKYNYLKNVNRELRALKEEERECLLQSIYAPQSPLTSHPKITHQNIVTANSSPIFSPQQELIYDQLKIQASLQLQQQRLKTEQLRLNYALLEQQNIGLKQKISYLQTELNKTAMYKAQQKIQKTQKVSQQDERYQLLRHQIKQKFLEQIANLQLRSKKMEQQIQSYKFKQQQRGEKFQKQGTNVNTNSTKEYYLRFAQVFLNMVQKLPIDIEAEWPEKKKIAVGWKTIKYYIKKALKLGVPPPSIDLL